jgi:hypothetical protein
MGTNKAGRGCNRDGPFVPSRCFRFSDREKSAEKKVGESARKLCLSVRETTVAHYDAESATRAGTRLPLLLLLLLCAQLGVLASPPPHAPRRVSCPLSWRP